MMMHTPRGPRMAWLFVILAPPSLQPTHRPLFRRMPRKAALYNPWLHKAAIRLRKDIYPCPTRA